MLIILVLGYYMIGGYQRGFLLGVLDVGGFLLSFLAALKLYGAMGAILSNNFSISAGIANAAGFLLIGFISEIVLSKLITLLYKLFYPKAKRFLNEKKFNKTSNVINKILGLIPGFLEGLVFCAFILTLLVALPIQGAIKNDIVSAKIGGPLVSKTQGVERELNGIFGQAVNEYLTFLTVNPNPETNETIDLKFTQKNVTIDKKAEVEMFDMVNMEREKRGYPKLEMDEKLRDLARSYAKEMFSKGYFSHYNPEGQSPFDRMKKNGINFLAAGENLALAPNVTLAHQGLMNSPGHKANILSADFGRVGIGVIDGGIYGEMFVQEFTN